MKERSKLFHQLILALALAIGTIGATLLLLMLLGQTVFGLVESLIGPDPPVGESISLIFTASGEPYLWHSDPEVGGTDLEGNPIDAEPDVYNRPNNTVWLTNAPQAENSRATHEWLPWQFRITQFPVYDHNEPVSFWYLIYDAHSRDFAYLVGYSAQTNERIGFIGTAGFRSEPPPRAEWFPIEDELIWRPTQKATADAEENGYARADSPFRLVINCGSQVFAVDLETRQIRTLLADLKTPIRSLGAVDANRPSPLAMISDESIELVDPDDRRRTFPLPPQLRRQNLLAAIRSDGGLTVAIHGPAVFGSPNGHKMSVYVLAADGSVSGPREVTTIENTVVSSFYDNWFLVYFGEFGADVWTHGFLPLPLAPFLGSPAIQLLDSLPPDGEWQGYELLGYEEIHSPGQLVKLYLWRDRWWILMAVLAGGLFSAICYRRQLRYRVPLAQRLLWPLFVFLLGIPGWVGYRYCRRWPPLDFCPACHRRSPRNDEACIICGRAFPLPARKGTEIFA